MWLPITESMFNLANTCKSNWRTVAVAAVCIPFLVSLTVGRGNAQASGPATSVQLWSVPESSQSNTTAGAPQAITFADASQRARAIHPQTQAAFTAAGLAHQDLVQSRAALLPNVNYNMAAIYTQPTARGSDTQVFIANNGIHEYLAQGNVHQNLSLQMFADYSRAAAAQAVARAKAEIALRGLTVTVAQAYYGYLAAQHKYEIAQRANEEAQRFLDISQKLENGGEVAHSDVVKGQLQAQQQARDLREAELLRNKARLELVILIFNDFNENFTIVDDLTAVDPIPSYDQVTTAGTRNNPDLRAAQAALRQAGREVMAAWGGVLPSIGLDYWYGIDANRFATRSIPPGAPAGTPPVNNLGSAYAATLQLPIWTWGANFSKVKQANLQKKQAMVELSAAQRTLLADLRSFYDEAQAARAELELLSQSVQLATESLRLVNLRYQGGESTVLEVVDAQNTLTQASNAYNDGLVRFRVAIANLQTLTGKF